MSEPLQDTPRWSPWRRGTANVFMATGIGMIAVGAGLGLSDAVALSLIENGTGMLMVGFGVIVAGASGERVFAWWKGKT